MTVVITVYISYWVKVRLKVRSCCIAALLLCNSLLLLTPSLMQSELDKYDTGEAMEPVSSSPFRFTACLLPVLNDVLIAAQLASRFARQRAHT